MNTYGDFLKNIGEDFCLNKIKNFFLENGDIPDNLDVLWNSFLMKDTITKKEILKPVLLNNQLFLKGNSEFYTPDLEPVDII